MPPVERKGASSNSASGLRSGWLSASSSSACTCRQREAVRFQAYTITA